MESYLGVMRRKTLALALLLLLVFLAVAGKELVNWTNANPEPSVIQDPFDYMEIEITAPINRTYNTNMVQLNITAINSAGSINPWKIMYSVDGGPLVVVYSGKGNLTVEIIPTRKPSVWVNLPDGSHTIVAKAYNGMRYVCTNVSLTIDTVPPYLSIVMPENKTYNTSEVPLDFTMAELSEINYNIDGQANVSIAGNTTLNGIIDGAHNLVLFGTSPDGIAFASEPVFFGVNTGKPEIDILSIKNNTTYHTYDLDLTFYLSEPSPEIKYGLWDQSEYHGILGPFEPFIVITGNVTMTNLHSGLYLLVLTATDSLTGEIGFKEVFFGIENPFPTALVVAISIVTVVMVGIALIVYFKKRKH